MVSVTGSSLRAMTTLSVSRPLAADDDAKRLASASNVAVVLPAGTGKTELIASATGIAGETAGRQLILTHTHAGVHALKARLARLRVEPRSYTLSTIAGWALKWALHYPSISGLPTAEPTSPDEWNAVYRGVRRVLENPHLGASVRASYVGGFVDEYQDCTLEQHQVSLALAELMPLRVLGDPLQGIFGFTGEAIRWSRHVAPTFATFGVETRPWRWTASNPALGRWLLELRNSLLKGQAIDLSAGPTVWGGQAIRSNQIAQCQRVAADESASAVAILKWPHECHEFSKSLGGRFSSMDELEGRDLLQFAKDLDRAVAGHNAAAVFLEMAKKCFTRLPGTVTTMIQNFNKNKPLRITKRTTNISFVKAVSRVAEAPTPTNLLIAAKEMETIPGIFAHRSELWMSVKRSITVQRDEGMATTQEAAVAVRDRTRESGRTAELRTVSRTLLVKGLEYDHALILKADLDQLNAQEFYVAATRGRQTLTVLSDKPVLQFSAPEL